MIEEGFVARGQGVRRAGAEFGNGVADRIENGVDFGVVKRGGVGAAGSEAVAREVIQGVDQVVGFGDDSVDAILDSGIVGLLGSFGPVVEAGADRAETIGWLL